jgi:hypothetical protein
VPFLEDLLLVVDLFFFTPEACKLESSIHLCNRKVIKVHVMYAWIVQLDDSTAILAANTFTFPDMASVLRV